MRNVVWPALFAFLMTAARGAGACELAETRIVFPGQGTRLSYYCKATDAEKRQALKLARASDCIARKLQDWGRQVLSTDCHDFVSYSLSRPEAAKAGPILDCRLTLTSESDTGIERKTGYRVLATRRPGPGAPFEIGEPALFSRECSVTGCSEQLSVLCENTPTAAPY